MRPTVVTKLPVIRFYSYLECTDQIHYSRQISEALPKLLHEPSKRWSGSNLDQQPHAWCMQAIATKVSDRASRVVGRQTIGSLKAAFWPLNQAFSKIMPQDQWKHREVRHIRLLIDLGRVRPVPIRQAKASGRWVSGRPISEKLMAIDDVELTTRASICSAMASNTLRWLGA